MPKLGDIFAKLASGDELGHAEIEQVRREMNIIQTQPARVGNILDDTGGLDSDVFRSAGSFGVLPHPTGTLYKGAAQEIADGGGFSSITWDETSVFTVVRDMAYTPAADPTTFVMAGGAGATYLITARIKWEGHADGARSLLLATNEDNRFQAVSYPPDANVFQMQWSFIYHARKKETQFTLTAAQTSGVALDIQADNCYFSIARIR